MSGNPLIGAGAGGDVNPLKSDAELSMLLKKLDKVTKYKTFQRWKKRFLDRLEKFLYEKGMEPAERSANNFDKRLTNFVKMANKVTSFIEKGELSDEKKTVKSSLALNEMCKELIDVCNDMEALIPAGSKEEKKKKFTKFHLGAVLIRQGFHQYITMKAIEDAVTEISNKLQTVADKQQHEGFNNYKKQVQKFCDVMADLNLYEVMVKCLEFAEEPEEEESSDEEDIKIEIEVTTPDGVKKKLRLELDPNETIGNIKEAIQNDCEIPADKQVLKFKGKTLDNNNATLKGVGIGDGAKLTVEAFKIPIKVRNYDGTQIEVKVPPDIYMSDLKGLLEREGLGIAAPNQRLYKDGKELDNDFLKASDYDIKAGTILDLEPKSIKVNVEMPDGSTREIAISTSDTVDSIKDKIEDETGMPAKTQLLKMDGKELPSGKTVKDLGIKDGSNIKVGVFKVPVTVNTHDGRQIKAMIDPSAYLSDIKRQLEAESGVPAANQRLYKDGFELADDMKRAQDYGIKDGSVLDLEPKSIKISVDMPDGSKVELEVSPSDTGDSLKKKIKDKTGFEVPRQVLKHNGKEIGKDQKLKQAGVQDGSNIKVEVKKVPITVNDNGKQIQVMVDPFASLGDIKKALEGDSGLSADNQKLSMNGQELADDGKRAADYGIKEGSVLDLSPKTIKVSVDMPDGSTKPVEISPMDNSDAIKKKIEAQTGMKAPRQVVKFNGKELPTGKNARDMGITDGSKLKVEVFKVPVVVKTMDGKRIKVMVDPTDQISAIKSDLEAESGIPAKNQKLFFDGKELQDAKTAGDYGIKPGSELMLEPKTMSIDVEMPDGSTQKVDISPSDTTEEIKKKIEAKTGMQAPRQVLKLNGKELAKGKRAKDQGVQDGSKIKCEVFKVPVTVKTMDGKRIKVMVDPLDKLGDLKKQLEGDTGIRAGNQSLKMGGKELQGDNKTAKDHGIQAGSEIDLEPKSISVTVDMPDGSKAQVDIAPSDNKQDIKNKIAAKTGLDASRQVVKFNGKEIPDGKAVRDLGIKEGDNLGVDFFKIPIFVTYENGSEKRTIDLKIEPAQTIGSIKKMLAKETGLAPGKQMLSFEDEELKEDVAQALSMGIVARSVLTLEPRRDPIIFVDIKCGTLFGLEREVVLEKGALSPYQGNKLDFTEAAKDSAAREKILKAMKGSPKLGFSPQVVVEKIEVDEYDLAEAEKVKGVWGVSLKKHEKNKKGEELIFCDPKTGACGELSRKKFIDNKWITPQGATLAEAEKDTMQYDKYINMLRGVFGVKSAK